jgi:hypothetical protein
MYCNMYNIAIAPCHLAEPQCSWCLPIPSARGHLRSRCSDLGGHSLGQFGCNEVRHFPRVGVEDAGGLGRSSSWNSGVPWGALDALCICIYIYVCIVLLIILYHIILYVCVCRINHTYMCNIQVAGAGTNGGDACLFLCVCTGVGMIGPNSMNIQ